MISFFVLTALLFCAEFCITDEFCAKPGDLIEFAGKVYAHWGVYVGCGHIIHLKTLGNDTSIIVQEKLTDVA
jgi:cell wall-associated NlpC family hydrolase